MPSSIKLRALVTCALLWASISAPAHAQSVTSGSVTGTVTDEAGRPLPRVVVTLQAMGAGTGQETLTGNDGAYRFALVSPGTYEIRAEAIGRQPLLARPLEIAGSDVARVPLVLRPATPPVISVDTIALEVAASNRARPGGVRFGGDDVRVLPHRFHDLASLSALSTRFDASLGSEGLPGSMTVLYGDGLPVYRARHPLYSDESLPDAFFPGYLLSNATVFHAPPDIEWASGGGGYGAVSTLSGVPGRGTEIEGSWSGGPLWSSDRLSLPGTPDLTSFRGAGRSAVTLKPDTTELVVAAEGFRHEAPVGPRVSESLAGRFDAVDPEIVGSLTAPAVERVSRYAGLARFYTRPSESSFVFLRGTVAYSERTFDGPGPLVPGALDATDEASTDFSLAGSFVSEYRPGITLEFRGGVSHSDRTFRSPTSGLPSAYVADLGLPLAGRPGEPGAASRTDAVFVPMARFDLGSSGSLKAGVSARASRHDFTVSPWGPGDLVFSDVAALLAGRGLGQSADQVGRSFGTREMGAFIQYDASPSPGLDIALGGRFDYERIPSAEPRPNTAWQEASGISNDEYPTSFPKLGGSFALSWDPADDGRTRFFTVGSVQTGNMDPARLFEVFSRDGTVESTTHLGSGLDWVNAAVAPTGAPRLPMLALFGPDTRPPRSLYGSVGLVREVGMGLSLHLSGDMRRTDFLLRRRNLNLPTTPSATDQFSRAVHGTLEKEGALIAATGADARRFPAFGAVWALDPDGWSEYRGVTVGVEFRSPTLDLYGSFTRSETRDNWMGAAAHSPDAQLSPRLPDFVEDWDEGTSDFDAPNRVAATALVRIPGLTETTLSATYRYSSGRPFTPGYRRGVDANGDGSFGNDVPFVPQPEDLGSLHDEWRCLRNQSGGFAVRNSCRGPASQTLSAHLAVGLGSLGDWNASLFVEGLDLIEGKDGLIDEALILVDPEADLTFTSGGSRVHVPYALNPDFGNVLLPYSRGRMLRVGMRIGG